VCRCTTDSSASALLLLLLLQVDAAHVCYLVAGVTPAPLDVGPAARMLLLGVNHTTIAGQSAMRQLLPLMRSEVYEWARSLAGGDAVLLSTHRLSSTACSGRPMVVSYQRCGQLCSSTSTLCYHAVPPGINRT
jgi:hypothetical protein